MRRSVVALSIAILSMAAPNVWADGIGLTVSGIMTLYRAPGDTPLRPEAGQPNYLDSVNGLVPAGYGNSTPGATAVIGSGVEFGLNNGSDLLTINFTGTTVTLTDTCVGPNCGRTPVTISIYSPFITGYTILSDTLPDTIVGFGDDGHFPGPSGSITFFGDAVGFTGGSLVASYTSIAPPAASPSLRTFSALSLASVNDPADPPDPPAVPEPATFGLMAAGLVGLAGLVRKRFA